MSENLELIRGYKEYDSKVKNLEGIIAKVEKIFDVSEYKKEFCQIKYDVENDADFSKDMIFSAMQLEYESYVFNAYCDRLDALTKKLEEELLPFYELYLLYFKIDNQISKITGENIGNIIQDTKTLIDTLNTLNTHNQKEKNDLIEKAYQTIYSVIMYEEIFDRSDILNYINSLNISTNKENIGRLLSNDLEKIDDEELIEEDLRAIKTEGLGYDYLNSDFIRKVSRKTVGEGNSEYQERKRQAISEISTKVINFSKEKDGLVTKLNDSKGSIRHLYINKAFLATRVLSMVLVPVMTFSAGRMIGKSLSNKITEYKTITRTVDLDTGKVIGEPQEVYDENETTYVATVLVYGPWRKNPTGVGYIQDVTAYEYIAPDNIDEGYHATVEDLEGNVLEKYKYIQPKDVLGDGDSMTDSTILITETYQDKNVTKKSTKYIIPFSIGGALIGLGIDVLLMLLGVYDLRKIKIMFESLDNEISEYKLSYNEIKDRLKNMAEEALLLKDQYNDVVKKYGSWGEQFVFGEIDTSWIIEDTKKRSKSRI